MCFSSVCGVRALGFTSLSLDNSPCSVCCKPSLSVCMCARKCQSGSVCRFKLAALMSFCSVPASSGSRGRQRAGRGAAADGAGDLWKEPDPAAADPHTPAVQFQHLEQRRFPSAHRWGPECCAAPALVEGNVPDLGFCFSVLLRTHPVHVHCHQGWPEAVQEEIWSTVSAGHHAPLLRVRCNGLGRPASDPESLNISSLSTSGETLTRRTTWARTTFGPSERRSVASSSITSARACHRKRCTAFWDTLLPLEMKTRWVYSTEEKLDFNHLYKSLKAL